MTAAPPVDTLFARWSQVWRRAGLSGDPARVFDALVSRYTEPGRHYHTLDHISTCLLTLDSLSAQIDDRVALELALWAHDVVYDPRTRDNEAQSARWIVTWLEPHGAPPNLINQITRLILATRHAQAPDPSDEALITDLDLAVLGQPWDAYARYAYAIRCEHAWVDDRSYRSGRSTILDSFLNRPMIYVTPAFNHLEAQARANLSRERAWYGQRRVLAP